MAVPIRCQPIGQPPPRIDGPRVLHLLPGEVEGVQTRYYFQASDTERLLARQELCRRALLFVEGEGHVETETETFSVSGIAALCPARDGRTRITAAAGGLEYLEIVIQLHTEETLPLLPQAYFIAYSQCAPYAEAIKSAKTVSRTIIPANILPRFCMGSVETTGPDAVGAHSHPMLEQLFFGLTGNRCIVTADGAETELGERVLLHIPRGSRHGVRVAEGCRLHYVWMDFFSDEAGLAYLQEQHKPL